MITTESFDSAFWPDEVAGTVALSVIEGAPLARSLTPFPTSKPQTSFPRAAPTGFDWVAEGQPLPSVALNDDAHVVATAKLAGTFDLSNESIDDADVPLGQLLGQAVQDAMSPELDAGLLFGAGAPEPEGIVAAAPESVSHGDFRADVIAAWAELVDAGANPETIAAYTSAGVIGWELSRTADGSGVPLHADGAAMMVGPGIRMVPVPMLAGQTLVLDTSRVFLVIRADFTVEFSEHAKFGNDSTVCRVTGRFSVAAPTPAKSMRLITAAS